jgi:hypothetical protein
MKLAKDVAYSQGLGATALFLCDPPTRERRAIERAMQFLDDRSFQPPQLVGAHLQPALVHLKRSRHLPGQEGPPGGKPPGGLAKRARPSVVSTLGGGCDATATGAETCANAAHVSGTPLGGRAEGSRRSVSACFHAREAIAGPKRLQA